MRYEVPSQAGKTFVITGSNTGIGRITAEKLAEKGAHVVLVNRSKERTQPVLDALGDRATFIALDLASLQSVRAGAEQVLALGRPIHGLINNAGLAGTRGETRDGFELTFGTNHVGHYLFTRLLLDRVKSSAPARIVNVASRAHARIKGIDYNAVRGVTRTTTGLPEYSNSKLANVLFSMELNRRLEGTGVSVYSLHPGVVATDIWRSLPGPLEWLATRFMITPEEGAMTTLFCATDPSAADRSGLYWDRMAPRKPSSAALDPQAAAELWKRSAEWVGLAP